MKLDPESLVVILQDLAGRLGSSLSQPLVVAAVAAAFVEFAAAAAAIDEYVVAAFEEPVIVAMESVVDAAVA